MSPQITDDVVTAHYSTRDTSIPQGNEGNQRNKDNQDPCFAGLYATRAWRGGAKAASAYATTRTANWQRRGAPDETGGTACTPRTGCGRRDYLWMCSASFRSTLVDLPR
jgi:hypothetical protein